MRAITVSLTVGLLVSLAGCCHEKGGAACCASGTQAMSALPPLPPREFRAAWVATVANIDWPSKPGLSTDQQVSEMRAILDKAAELHLNAVILQVRTSCDAFYASPYEPWSEYLTGKQGVPPEPYYDPLATWVREAHLRGIELHAWFNPYRARHSGAKSPDAPGHVSNTQPEIVRKFRGWEWLDPGEPEARRQTLDVILDVVKRYDIDGVHLDDYFYPYPEYLGGADFPDDASWKKYQDAGGKLARADWRRENVNRMIRDIYYGIKAEKPRVKFGISPFGIYRPGNPETVKSKFDQYSTLYADAKLWLNQGWCDYFTPQLYWRLQSDQPYADLLKWWVGENTQGRHLWPGNYVSQVGTPDPSAGAEKASKVWPASEIVDQIEATRAQEGAGGNVFFSMKAFMENRGGIDDLLERGPYRDAALVPASPWLDHRPLQEPLVEATSLSDGSVQLHWDQYDMEPAWQWAVWARYGDEWRFSTYPGQVQNLRIVPEQGKAITAVNVASVDRAGNAHFGKPIRVAGRRSGCGVGQK
jgi:uncharacterized lipoprotein YddW (UPF0748 family)